VHAPVGLDIGALTQEEIAIQHYGGGSLPSAAARHKYIHKAVNHV